MSHVEIVQADLDRPEHGRAIVELLNAYATDPLIKGAPLPAEVLQALIPGLKRHPTTLVFLAYQEATAVGIAICFLGFSTFSARPLVNIHDLAVLPAHRKQGVSRLLLDVVEAKARQLGCCAITLEVGENNARARDVYQAAGFEQSLPGEAAGSAFFLTKRLKG